MKHTLDVSSSTSEDGLPMDAPTLPTSRPPIQDFLDHVDIGPDDSTLTLKMVANREAWRRVFCERKNDHSLGFIALDRSPYNTYKALMTYDTAPVFTRQNHTIMIFGKEGAPEAPPTGRFLKASERAKLMGFCPDSLRKTLSESQMVKAVGNSMCVPVAKCVLAHVLGYVNQCIDACECLPPTIPLKHPETKLLNHRPQKKKRQQMSVTEATVPDDATENDLYIALGLHHKQRRYPLAASVDAAPGAHPAKRCRSTSKRTPTAPNESD